MRRSTREKFAPLEHWRGERLTFTRSRRGIGALVPDRVEIEHLGCQTENKM